MIPENVYATYSAFGEINDLLITTALTMLMQNNANLFAVAVVQVLNTINVGVPKILYE